MLRSDNMLSCVRRFCVVESLLVVSTQHMAINNHKPNFQDTTHIFDEQGQITIFHSSEDWLLHCMNEKMKDNL
jgi:hypothetical protein